MATRTVVPQWLLDMYRERDEWLQAQARLLLEAKPPEPDENGNVTFKVVKHSQLRPSDTEGLR